MVFVAHSSSVSVPFSEIPSPPKPGPRRVTSRAGVRAGEGSISSVRFSKHSTAFCSDPHSLSSQYGSLSLAASGFQKKLAANCLFQPRFELLARHCIQPRRLVSFIYANFLEPFQKLGRGFEAEKPTRGQRVVKAGRLVIEHHVVGAGDTHEVVASGRRQQEKQVVR